MFVCEMNGRDKRDFASLFEPVFFHFYLFDYDDDDDEQVVDVGGSYPIIIESRKQLCGACRVFSAKTLPPPPRNFAHTHTHTPS